MAAQTKVSLEEKIKLLHDNNIDLEKKIIYVTGELDADLGINLRKSFSILQLYWLVEKKTEIDEITIYISSTGGEIYAAFGAIDFYDELKRGGVLVNTTAFTQCMSAATILLFGGTGIRSASSRCKFMLHDIWAEVFSGNTNQVFEYAKNMKIEQEEFFRFYALFSKFRNHKKIHKQKLDEETNKWLERFASNSLDNYITSKEAAELKLIDKII